MCVGNRGGQWDWVVRGLSFVGKKLWGWRGGGRSEVGEWSGARREYGAGWRVDRLHRNPMPSVLLPDRRKQVDCPLGPGLVGRNIDVLHAELRELLYVGLVAGSKLRSDVHQGASFDWLDFTLGMVMPATLA